MKVIFNANCSNFGQIGLQCGQKLVHIISRISRNFSREMGHFFSHLARNPKREKCAALHGTYPSILELTVVFCYCCCYKLVGVCGK